MGWTSEHRDKGISNKDWLQAQFGEGYTVVDAATIRGTIYAALRCPDGSVTGIVALTKWAPNDAYFNFTHKVMEEEMGPCEDQAPARILDLLTPTEHPYAIEWRARCRQRATERVSTKGLRVGARVFLAQCLPEGPYTITRAGRSLLGAGPDGLIYRIPRTHISRIEA